MGTGNSGAAGGRPLEELVESMYSTLRKLARRQAQRGAGPGALDPTEIVHECYLKLAQAIDGVGLDRVGFVALAAKVIRQTLVDQARAAGAMKRGGCAARITLHEDAMLSDDPLVDLLDLDEALRKLAVLDERQTRVIELRFFGGLTNEEVAAVLGISRRAVVEEWNMARAWLQREFLRGLRDAT
jgi:RNA polymerase sigma factor (TIGR02999 family)